MSDETKDKIMNAARVLFANKGYDGTSVRDIAKAAEVNVASVNYYFTKKENLFVEIVRSGYLECAEKINLLLQENKGNLENTLVDFFHYFLENSHDFLSHFKMMMSDQHSHHQSTQGTVDGTYGPPGGMIIAEVLRKECPSCSEEDLHWALKTLFSHVTHLSLIHTCCGKNNKSIPFSTTSDLEKSIRRITKMVLKELRNPQNK